jgi:hypothetical protein
MINDHGADAGIIGREKGIDREKPVPVPLSQLQIPHDLAWYQIRVAAMRSQRLIGRAIEQP